MRLNRVSIAATATLSVLAGSALAACSTTSATSSAQDLLTLPVVLPLTGSGAEYGTGDQIAMRLAVQQVNKDGGIDGIKLQTKVYDDGSDPVKSAQVMRNIAKDSLLVLGPNLSTTAQAGFPVANSAKLPAVTSSVSDRAIMQKNQPWAFDLFLTAQELEPLGAGKWLAATHVRSVVAIVDKEQDAATSQAAATLGALRQQGVTVRKTIQVSESQPGYNAEASLVKSLHPDGIVVSAFPEATGAIAKALRNDGMDQPMLFTTTSVTPDSLKVGGASMTNGSVILEYWPHLMDQRADAFDAAFVQADKGQEPEPTAAYMYDSVLVAARAIKDSGIVKSSDSLQDKRAKVRQALRKIKFSGVTGDVSFRPDGTRAGSGVWVNVQEGKVVPPQQ